MCALLLYDGKVHMMPYLSVNSNDSFSVILLLACRRRCCGCLHRLVNAVLTYNSIFTPCTSQLYNHFAKLFLSFFLSFVSSFSLCVSVSLSHLTLFLCVHHIISIYSCALIRSGGRYLMWVYTLYIIWIPHTHNSPARIISH